MRKVTLVWTLKFAVLLWNDWTGGQLRVISKQHSQLHRFHRGGALCRSRLPCDFPVRNGSGIYFTNAGICLLMCFWKLHCVLDFDDFCSWKKHFGVGMYAFIPFVLREFHCVCNGTHILCELCKRQLELAWHPVFPFCGFSSLFVCYRTFETRYDPWCVRPSATFIA